MSGGMEKGGWSSSKNNGALNSRYLAKGISREKLVVFSLLAFVIVVYAATSVVFRSTDTYGTVLRSYDESKMGEPVACDNLAQEFTNAYPRLGAVEVLFSDLGSENERTGTVLVSISQEGEILYTASIATSTLTENEWRCIYVNMPLDVGAQYELALSASDDCEHVPSVATGASASGAYHSGQAASELDGQICVRYDYMKPLGKVDALFLILSCLGFLIAVFLLLLYEEKAVNQLKRLLDRLKGRSERNVIVALFQALLCQAIVGCSGIEFQTETVVALQALSLASGFLALRAWGHVSQLANAKWKRAALAALYLYSAFALVGQRLLIYPLDMIPGWQGVTICAIAAIWSIPCINLALFAIDELSSRFVNSRDGSHGSFGFILLSAAFLLVPAAIQLVAVNPGMSSPDTYSTLVNSAHNLHGADDWHPAFYSMLLRAIIKVWDSTYAVIIVQYVFWAFVFIDFLLLLNRKGVKLQVLLVFAFLLGANAGNFYHLNTIWKDIPYAIALVWAFVALAKLLLESEFRRRRLFALGELAIALVLVYLLRKNGFVAFGLIALGTLVVFRKQPGAWVAIAMSVALVLVVKGPIYSHYEIEDTGNRGSFIGLGQDMLGVYFSEGSVSQETLDIIVQLRKTKADPSDYRPTWASYEGYEVDATYGEFIAAYLDTFLRNPAMMARAIIAREDAAWSIFPGKDAVLGCVNFTDTQDGVKEWNEYYQKRKPYNLADNVNREMGAAAKSQVLNAIEWRSGFASLTAIIIVVLFMLHGANRRNLLLLVPVVSQALGLLLSTGWSDFRYFWPINLLVVCMLLMTFLLLAQRKRGSEHADDGDLPK